METQPTDAQIDAIADELYEKYLTAATTPGVVPSQELAERYVAMLYRVGDSPMVPVKIVSSRIEALRLTSKGTGSSETSIDWISIGHLGWLANRIAGERLGLLGLDAEEKEIMADVHTAVDALAGGIFSTVATDEICYVIPYPSVLHLDADGNLHKGDGPAVQWSDEDLDFAWHGVWIPRQLTDGTGITAEEYLAMSTEVRRAAGEILGWPRICELLGVAVVDSWTDPSTSLRYDLLASPHAGVEKWIRKQSPKIRGGAQPIYLEPVHEELRTAKAARRWQAPPFLTPAECEKNPDLTYRFES